MRKIVWMLAGALAALPFTPAAAADTPTRVDLASWARWQGRLSLVTASDPWRLGVERPSARLEAASLMGDYYFARWPGQITGRPGGLRLTSGLVYGARGAPAAGLTGMAAAGPFSIANRPGTRAPASNAAEPPADTATVPYVGIGYTGLWERSRWALSADLGLVAQKAGDALRLARAGGSAVPTLDDQVRDLRLRPLLQLGVSYAF